MENQRDKFKPHFHPISSLFLFLVMFGIASLSQSLALSGLPTKEALNNCVAKIFEYDREQIFADVPIQQWYTHGVHFLSILDEGLKTVEGEESNAADLKFFPGRAVTRKDFLKMIKAYEPIFQNKKASTKTANPNAKVTKQQAAVLIARLMGISGNQVLKIFREEGIKGRFVLRREAAHILNKSAELALPNSLEQTVCKLASDEDKTAFEEMFASKEMVPPLTPVLTPETDPAMPDPETPETPGGIPGGPESNPQTPDPNTPQTPAGAPQPARPSTARAQINFAPVNPRAGETVKVTVTAYDDEGKPASGAKLSLGQSAGIDFEKQLPLKERGTTGIYEGELTSTWAGKYAISAVEGSSTIPGAREITFQPHYAESLKLRVETPQEKSASKHEVVIAAVLQDKFANPVSSEARDYRVTTSMGTVKKVEKIGQEIFATVEADRWGEAEINISHLNRSSVQDAGAKIKIPFTAYVLDVPKGMEVGKEVTIPVHLFLPKDKGKIGSYRFKLNIEKKDLTYVKIADLDPADSFDAAKVSVPAEGMLLFEQSASGLPQEGVVPVGAVTFLTNTVATSGTIMVGEGTVITDHEKVIAMPDPEFGDGPFRWWYGIKPNKTICLDIWLAEGSDTTRREALGDVEKASNMYLNAASVSHCPFHMNFDINFHAISAVDWAAKVDAPGGTANVLDNGEEVNLRTNFSGPKPECVQIWYVPDIAPLPSGLDPAGLSYSGNGGVAVDNHGDGIDHVLGHELNHQLSNNDVLDSPNDPGNTQGALDPKNAMNYNDPGFRLTKAQCELMKRKPYVK